MSKELELFYETRIKELSHSYIEGRDRACILDRCLDDKTLMVGFLNADWKDDMTITSEYYNIKVYDDMCIAFVKDSVKASSGKEFLIDFSIVCKKIDDDIEILSVHISETKNGTLVQEIEERDNLVYGRALSAMYEVKMEYHMYTGVFKYDEKAYKIFFEVDTHFVTLDQWFWHMCTESVHPDDTEKLDLFRGSDINKRIRKGDCVIVAEFRIRNKELGYKWIKMIVILIVDENTKRLERTLVLFRSVHERKIKEIENECMAKRDTLTQVYNRYYIEKCVNESLSDSKQTSVFALIDVDYFKRVNDSYGHLSGDDVLIKIASGMIKVVGDKGFVGRIGGDEFVVYMPNVLDERLIMDKISNIMKEISFTYSEDGVAMDIHCSAGVAVRNSQTNCFDDFYSKADIALLEAKKNGKNTFVIAE